MSQRLLIFDSLMVLVVCAHCLDSSEHVHSKPKSAGLYWIFHNHTGMATVIALKLLGRTAYTCCFKSIDSNWYSLISRSFT